MPEKSPPNVAGNFNGTICRMYPSLIFQSTGLTPAVCTSIRSRPWDTLGFGAFVLISTTSLPPYLLICAAFIFLIFRLFFHPNPFKHPFICIWIDCPVNRLKECLNIICSLPPVINHECMLKDIHDQHGTRSGEMTNIVFIYPCIKEKVCHPVIVQDCPAYAAH